MASQVVAIPAITNAYLKAINESLSTHENLNGMRQRIDKAAKMICENFDAKRVSFFIIITHRGMGVGRFCLIHNHKVDDFIIDEKYDELYDWVRHGKMMCVEVYDNPKITSEEIAIIEKHLMKEINAVDTAIRNYDGINGITQIMPCVRSQETEVFSENGKGGGYRSLVENCHSTICLASNIDVSPLNADRLVQIFDHPVGHLVPTIYCYDLIELLGDLIAEIPVNRRTNKPFDAVIVQRLRERYNKELRMVMRYHEWLDQGGQ